MNKITEKLMEAQKYAMSIRPKVGGFPVLAEVLREAGVQMNRWSLPSCQSVYLMKDGQSYNRAHLSLLGLTKSLNLIVML